MKKLILLLFAFTNQLAFSQSPNIEEITTKTLDKITAHQSVTYDVLHENKMYWSVDTTSSFATCSIIRNEEDTFAKGYSSMFISEYEDSSDNSEIIQQPSREYIYDGEILTYKSQSIDSRRVYQDNARDLGSIPNNVLLNHYFLRPALLKQLLKDAVFIEEVSFKTHSCYHIQIKKEPSDKYRDQQIDMWIDQKSFDILIIKEQFQYQNMDGFQYDEWRFEIESYDEVTLVDLEKRRDSILEEYEIYKYLRAKYKTKALIHPEEDAPNLVGWSVFEEREVSLFEYLNSPVVLYFWNAKQSNSVNGLGDINELSAKYAPFGIVFIGVTSNQTVLSKRMKEFFNNEKNRKIIDEQNIQIPEEGISVSNDAVLKILNSQHVNFANLMVNPSIIENYGAIGYPEMVLINETGKVILSSAGFDDSKIVELESKLEKLID